jgi:hypothetical protein
VLVHKRKVEQWICQRTVGSLNAPVISFLLAVREIVFVSASRARRLVMRYRSSEKTGGSIGDRTICEQ